MEELTSLLIGKFKNNLIKKKDDLIKKFKKNNRTKKTNRIITKIKKNDNLIINMKISFMD